MNRAALLCCGIARSDGRSPYGEMSSPTTKKLDLGLVVFEGETLFGTLTYAASLFERPAVERFAPPVYGQF